MKRRYLSPLLLLFLILSITPLRAEEKIPLDSLVLGELRDRIVDPENEYFGETIERKIVYEGTQTLIDKILFYYNRSRILVKEETLLTDYQSGIQGYYKMIVYYDEDHKKLKKELYYTDFLTDNTGFLKQVHYYNPVGKVMKIHQVDKYGTIIFD